MPFHDPLIRSGIAALANVPNDVMTFWIRRGVLRPIEAAKGTGNRLRFPWYEANIAALMNQLRIVGVPIEGLVSIAGQFRGAVAWAEKWGLSRDDTYALSTVFTMRALRGRGDYGHDEDEYQAVLGIWRLERHGAQRVTERIEALADKVGKDEFRWRASAFLTITEQPEPQDERARYEPDVSYFWRSGDMWLFTHGEGGPACARRSGALATIAVDVSTVIYDVWNRTEPGTVTAELLESAK